MRGVATSAHEHQRHAQIRLKTHFVESAASGVVESAKRPLRPAMTLRQQRHRQKNRRGGDGKSDADFGIAVGAEAPFQRSADIVEAGKMRRALRAGRQGRPFDPALLQPSPVIGGMAHGQVGELGLVEADFEGVSARRVQKEVPHHRPERTRRDHRLGDEAVDGAKYERLIDRGAGDDSQRRIEGKMSDEYRKPAQHYAFWFGKEPVAPIEHGVQGPLTRRRGPRSEPKQGQALIEKRCGLLQPVGVDPPGGQLDRKRHAVELSADADHDRGLRVAVVQPSAARRRALHEELRRRERLSDRRGESRIVGRAGERIQPVDVLALDLKSLATCRQDVDLRRRREDLRCERCNSLDEMLASIEHQENSLIPQIGDQGRRGVVRLNR